MCPHRDKRVAGDSNERDEAQLTKIADTLERPLQAARSLTSRYAAAAAQPTACSSREGPAALLVPAIGAADQTYRCLDLAKEAQCRQAGEARHLSQHRDAVRRHSCGLCRDIALATEELEGLALRLRNEAGQATPNRTRMGHDAMLAGLYRAIGMAEERTSSDVLEGD